MICKRHVLTDRYLFSTLYVKESNNHNKTIHHRTIWAARKSSAEQSCPYLSLAISNPRHQDFWCIQKRYNLGISSNYWQYTDCSFVCVNVRCYNLFRICKIIIYEIAANITDTYNMVWKYYTEIFKVPCPSFSNFAT